MMVALRDRRRWAEWLYRVMRVAKDHDHIDTKSGEKGGVRWKILSSDDWVERWTGRNRLEGRNNTHDHGHQDEHTTR